MNDLKELLQQAVNTGEDVKLPFTPIREVEKELKELGFEELEMDGDETNGWQIDFFYKFKHPEKGTFMLSGSLHYGGMLFGKADEEED